MIAEQEIRASSSAAAATTPQTGLLLLV